MASFIRNTLGVLVFVFFYAGLIEPARADTYQTEAEAMAACSALAADCQDRPESLIVWSPSRAQAFPYVSHDECDPPRTLVNGVCSDPPSCGPDMHVSGNICVYDACPDGLNRVGNICVSPVNNCPPNEVKMSDGTCGTLGQGCPAGQVNVNGFCMTPYVDCSQHPNADGCITQAPPPPPVNCNTTPNAPGCILQQGPPDPKTCAQLPDTPNCKPPPTCADNPDAIGCKEPPPYCKDHPTDASCGSPPPWCHDHPEDVNCASHCASTPSDKACPNYCQNNPSDKSCPGYCVNNADDTSCPTYCNNHPSAKQCGGYCQENPDDKTCPNYCVLHPTDSGCSDGSGDPDICKKNPTIAACQKNGGQAAVGCDTPPNVTGDPLGVAIAISQWQTACKGRNSKPVGDATACGENGAVAAFTCDADPIVCMQVKVQQKVLCMFDTPSTERPDGIPDLPSTDNGDQFNVTADTSDAANYDSSGFLGSSGCPDFGSVQTEFLSVDFNRPEWCTMGGWIAALVLAMAYFRAAQITMGA